MSISDLFWIFFVVMTLQPLVQQKLRDAGRVRSLRALERRRGSRVIALIHRQETVALLGFPISRYIDIDDSEDVLRAIKLTAPGVPIDVILHTPGGARPRRRADRARAVPPPRQGHGVRPALRDVRRHVDRNGSG
jgi:ClpP class serine protease